MNKQKLNIQEKLSDNKELNIEVKQNPIVKNNNKKTTEQKSFVDNYDADAASFILGYN